MKKILLYIMLVLLCFSCEKEEKYVVATVTTSVSDITESSAVFTVTANIEKGKDADLDINITERGFDIRRAGVADRKTYTSDPYGILELSDLHPMTTYWVAAYVKFGNRKVEGNTVTFTTDQKLTVKTTVTDITRNSAVMRGAVSIKKGKEADDITIVEKGFYCRRKGNDWKKFEVLSPDNFNFGKDYTELAPQTTYEVQAYVKIEDDEIEDDEVKGNIVTFTTKAETAQVRFKREQGSSVTEMAVVDFNSINFTIVRSYTFFGTNISQYYDIPVGKHSFAFRRNGSWEFDRDKYVYDFQVDHKYTVTAYNNMTYSISDDGTFSSSALKSLASPAVTTVSGESLKVQERMVGVVTDKSYCHEK